MGRKKKPAIDVTGTNLHYNENVDSLAYYLKDIRKYDVLPIEKERELIFRIKAGDKSAENELIAANQRFVLAVAKRYSNGDNISDLVQDGNLGMLDALNSFDPDRKNEDGTPTRFLSYASWFIKRNISFSTINNGLIRKTNNVKTVYKINKIKSQFYLENGRVPTVDEISEIIEKEYGIKIKDKSYVYDLETKHLSSSLDGANKDETIENSVTFNKSTADHNTIEDVIDKEYTKQVADELLNMLGVREQKVIKLLFGINCDREFTIEEVADALNLSRERVRQIKNSTITKLKRFSKANASKYDSI